MTDVQWLDDREAAAWQAVRDLGQPLWTALGRDLQRDSGLSMADYQVLVVLSETGGDVLAYRDLADATGWEKSRLSHQLTRMQARGLVHRTERSDDGRCANVVLTEHGRRVIESAAPGHVCSVRRFLIDRLSAAQIDALIAIGGAVRAGLDDAAGPGSAAAPQEPAVAAAGR